MSPRRAASPPPYAELAATSNFSFLAGASHPEELVVRAVELGLAGLGLADRNTVAGVVRAHAALKEMRAQAATRAAAGDPDPDDAALANFRLIVGARLGFVDGTPDIIAYPEDRAAWGRLTRLLTHGNKDAPKGECHLSRADLLAHAHGLLLIVVAPERPDAALAATLAELAAARPGAVHLGLALNRDGADARRIAAFAALARAQGLPLLAIGDVLYHVPARRPLQDILTCIRLRTTVFAAGRRLEVNAERHLKPAAEVARLWRMASPIDLDADPVAATAAFLARIRFRLDDLAYEYPDEPVPPGLTPQRHLEALTWSAARQRYPRGIPPDIAATLVKELALIGQLRFAAYFLTVHDIVAHAKSCGILCQGRGSAANSAVCFMLGITGVDPAEVDLLFERFISPERGEPPDIDVDFEHERREEVIQYIYRRYGRARAALCATVISYRSRSAIRDVGKALGLSDDVTGALAGTVWGTSDKALAEKRIREAGLDPADPGLRQATRLAAELIGFPRHLSQHVGGFVLTRGRLDETVPIGNAAMPERTFIEWDKDDIDTLGIMKVDVLALGMLTAIRKAFAFVRETEGAVYTLTDFPRDDAGVYDMLSTGDSLGVFQVESRAQMNMLPRLKPRNFYDLVIEVAIVRPGPIQGDMVHPYLRRRSGAEKPDFPSPSPEYGPPDELRQVLGKTCGVPLFQEQAMRIAMVAAEFSGEEANQLRRAMATFRKMGTIHGFRTKMVEGMVRRGYERDFAERCFKQIEGFGSYGFPESHAAAFAHLVYVSAFLKRYHPAAFAAALLNAQPMGFYAPAQIVRDAREHGVAVLPVDVNDSFWDHTLEPPPEPTPDPRDVRRPPPLSPPRPSTAVAPPPGAPPASWGRGGPALRLGLRAIEGFRADWGAALAANRLLPYADVESLMRRAGLPKAALVKLAAADACRSLDLDRRAAAWAVRRLPDDDALPLFAAAAAAELAAEPAARLPEMRPSEQVVADYRATRLSLKAHPVAFLRPLLARARVLPCAGIAAARDGAWCVAAGVVLVRQRPGTSSGVVFLTLEDETGIANVVVWPRVMEAFRRVVMGARLIEVAGGVQRSPEGVVHLVARRLVDRSGLLAALDGEPPQRLDPDAAPPHGRPAGDGPRRHPRDVRILPPSRDFH
jgi:error-prone DNA polymerase